MRWIGHAGLARHRRAGAPDRESLDAALALGLEMLELDVAVSADRRLALVHDLRLPDGQWVEQLELSALRAALPGLLTLDEAVEQLRGGPRLLLDLKDAAGAEPLGGWLAERGDTAAMVVCTDSLGALLRLRHLAPSVERWRTLPAVHSQRPGERRRTAIAVATRGLLPRRVAHLAGEVAAAGLSIDRRALTQALTAAAHTCGLEVAAWTANTPEAARRAERLGADWITSDSVAALSAELAARR